MVKTNKDLRWVLFEEWCSEIGPQSYETQLKLLKNVVKRDEKYKIRLITKYLRKLHSLGSNPPKLLFEHDFKYKNIIRKSSAKKNVMILGIKHFSLSFLLNRHIKFLPLYDIYIKLYIGIINNDENQLYECLNELKKTLKDLNPDIIILNSDAVPTGRAVVLVANELDIPTVEIQHGIYQSNFPLSTGKYASYVFVWGKYFKDLYLKKKIRPEREVKVLGYPYDLKKGKFDPIGKKKTVIYLGQNFESYNQKLIDTKIETVSKLDKLCNIFNFKFEYRPHPGDNLKFLKSKLLHVEFTSPNETLGKTIKKGDIFISFNSTSLVETALHSKLCIQLKNYDLPTDNFEKLGICPKSFDTIEELECYFKEISKLSDISKFHVPVNEDYIKIPEPDPGTRFLELIEEILQND